MAAELIGRVKAIPIMTDTKIPMINGCWSVAHLTASPKALAALPIGAAISEANQIPAKTVTIGVTNISILVSFEIIFPISDAIIAIK